MMWGIVPAAGAGSRILPPAIYRKLPPVGSRREGAEGRPRAVSEYLVERMLIAGATKICFVIAPGKYDILEYYGGLFGTAAVSYVVQPRPEGLCDAIFRALPLIQGDEHVLIGLPETIWFPENGFCALPDEQLSFLLFPVDHPEFFEAVITDVAGHVHEIQVKRPAAGSHWVWGAFKMPGRILRELFTLWCERGCSDVSIGILVNAWLAKGGSARAVSTGESYLDVGTLKGYREAIRLLAHAATGSAKGVYGKLSDMAEARPRSRAEAR